MMLRLLEYGSPVFERFLELIAGRRGSNGNDVDGAVAEVISTE
jgi:hypothetical protein